jgi:hypothetical protein
MAGDAAGFTYSGVRRLRDWRNSLRLPRVLGLNPQCIVLPCLVPILSPKTDTNKHVVGKPQKTRGFWAGLRIPPVP